MLEKVIQEAIENGLKQKIEERYEVLKKQVIADLDSKKVEIVAGIALEVMRQVRIEGAGNETIIRLVAPPK